jgi:oxazoline/thiazoline dehydrogenase
MVTHTVKLGDQPLATLTGPLAGALQPIRPDQRLVLSRFAWIRRGAQGIVAETSLTPNTVLLQDGRAHVLLYAFAAPRSLDSALALDVSLPLNSAEQVASVLVAAGILGDEDASAAEDEPPLASWEFHDLLFHACSRPGRRHALFGGTRRFQDQIAPLAAIAPERWAHRIALERPDFERLERDDPPLALAQSLRRSIRDYEPAPLSLTQLGEFLYRVARVEDYWERRLGGSTTMSFAPRPYPSGGAAYCLELYPAIQACQDIEPGLYHYESGAHELARVSPLTEAVQRLIAGAAAGMVSRASDMQVLIVIAARFGRVAWKYESIAYSLVLKEVGVLLQTMYLAATAMQLAPCAVGTGDTEMFAQAAGLSYYEESSVGEFALGSGR